MTEASLELLSKLPVAILLIQEPGVLKWANPRALAILGLPMDQLKDRLVLEIVHPEHRKQAAMRVGALMSGDAAPPLLYRVLRPNGTQVEFTCESVTAEIDGATYIVTVMREPCETIPSPATP
jgi:PAS domain S-box-containing protein